MIHIALTQGHTAVVDARDAHLAQHAWYAMPKGRTRYAARDAYSAGKRTHMYLHRAVLGLLPGDPRYVDHINGDGLDNRRENLRLVAHQQNSFNYVHKKVACSSTHRGVSWHKRAGKWRADLVLNGKQKYLGLFDSEIEAARAYDVAGVARDAKHFTPNLADEWVRVAGLWRKRP